MSVSCKEKSIVMEFHEKLQQLRKQKGLTQEELAEILFVSRTAVSKWESGRGYPNIDSLKAIAKFYAVTVDRLLSGEEVLDIAQQDTRQKEMHICDLVFAVLDLSTAIFFFLPFFGQNTKAVPLAALTEPSGYLRVLYWGVIAAMILLGITTLALQNYHGAFWEKNKNAFSLVLGSIGVLLFILSRQPYAGAFLFVLLLIKVFIRPKRQ